VLTKPASDVSTKHPKAWEKWHQSLDEVIKRKFAETSAQGNLRCDPPLTCEVKYDISRSGQILNLEITQITNSHICNIAAETIILSLEKDPLSYLVLVCHFFIEQNKFCLVVEQ
jgi:hypothetical protein